MKYHCTSSDYITSIKSLFKGEFDHVLFACRDIGMTTGSAAILDSQSFVTLLLYTLAIFHQILTCICLSLQKATAVPARKAEYFDASEPVQNRLYKSLKVWSMLADLEESLGTFKVQHPGQYHSSAHLCHKILIRSMVLSEILYDITVKKFPADTRGFYDRLE